VKRLIVHIVPSVEDEILRQVLYIAEDSVDSALAWEVRLRAAIKNLGGFTATRSKMLHQKISVIQFASWSLNAPT
jgi:hypothetical protein